MESTLGNFSNTNSSPHDLASPTLCFKIVFLGLVQMFLYITPNIAHRSNFDKKMDEYDERLKTHVSKISPRSRSSIQALGKTKSHLDIWRFETKNIKMGFSPYIQLIERFPDLSLHLKLIGPKLRYFNLKILVDLKIRV